MKVHDLVARCAKAAESSDAMSAVRGVLEELKSDLAALERSLSYVSGVGGNARQVFYRSPELTMLKVCFPAGRRTPPHDHGTWATILLLAGEEKNTLYRRENGALRRAGEKTLTSGAILTMRADTVHVAECLSEKPAIGLHVYGGDIFELPRFMFDPESLQEHPLDWTVYERFAQVASKAKGAPPG
ncbi:MAG TPA: cysteine dioxygenase family protein [Burkholderiales bacterium]|nr:cysteine dioxygenase family protein [Burkholderiales bacterium]